MKMKVRTAILVFGLIIILMGDVYGADWKFLEVGGKNVWLFYDAESITHVSTNIVSVWVMHYYTERVVRPLFMQEKFGKEYEKASLSMTLWEINCLEKKGRLPSEVRHDKKFNAIDFFSSPTEWVFIPPESIRESLYEKVCK